MPSLVGVAVKVTVVPGQMGVEGAAAMVTEGVTTGLTVMFIVLVLFTVEGLAQVAFEVKITLI